MNLREKKSKFQKFFQLKKMVVYYLDEKGIKIKWLNFREQKNECEGKKYLNISSLFEF